MGRLSIKTSAILLIFLPFLPHIHVSDVWLQQWLYWVLPSLFDESPGKLVDDEWLRGVEVCDCDGGDAHDCASVKSQLFPCNADR